MNESLLTIPQVAEHLQISITAVRNLIAAGQLTAINVGVGAIRNRWRVSQESLRVFEAARSAKAVAMLPQPVRVNGIPNYV